MSDRINIFNELYSDYYPMVVQLCTGFVHGDKCKAQDLSQEVFINVWNSLGKFQSRSSYKTWLYRITVNTCLKSFRNQSKSRKVYLEDSPHIDQQHDMEQSACSSQSALDRMYDCIGRLQSADRLLIMMALDNLDNAQIAHIMGISETNVRVRVHRIKQKIKKLFNDE